MVIMVTQLFFLLVCFCQLEEYQKAQHSKTKQFKDYRNVKCAEVKHIPQILMESNIRPSYNATVTKQCAIQAQLKLVEQTKLNFLKSAQPKIKFLDFWQTPCWAQISTICTNKQHFQGLNRERERIICSTICQGSCLVAPLWLHLTGPSSQVQAITNVN